MASNAKILIVDDLKDIRFILSAILSKEGYKVITADNGSAAIELVGKKLPDVVVMDIVMPKIDGIEAMKRIKKFDPLIPIILITAYGRIDTAVHTVKLGAYDYITKPFDNEKLLIAIKNALTERSLKQEVKTLRSSLNNNVSLTELMGSSRPIKGLVDQVNHVAPTNFTVVLYGETGTGKELVARAIHNQSMVNEGRLEAVDCGAIPETIIESELFGYEKGAFTGAEGKKEGHFELASNGTLFLDEIENLPLNMQGKLLRVLEGHSIRRIGGKRI